ncbi:hypothetical protein [Vibrio aestuarianus]|uniref:hypothetical protein n=1 Tax=Vibrio aestuarianus TaxID=28171 RepID=UPI0015C53EC7|nr:hypothetical protein [Vibrio aestuarianus]MDE1236499.1 hypothetical protein [Vibrio aestuarianus]MDE1247386.1 hypothetical protein [Vibrio aestuarianus]NGZ65188.1 hypothetical protein [Vibrio aestuarianus subsp. cardii]NGZ68187.1 hypothetical protein [Vibrio aestuarianus subsp. cardii]
MQFLAKHIENVIQANAQKLAVFSEQRYSFEEWLNLELCVSLCQDTAVNQSSVYNTPPYVGDTGKMRMDVSFVRMNKKHALELKIAHPGTLEKYYDACIHDLNKLPKALDCNHRFFALVVASTLSVDEFINDDEWNNWINKIFIGHTVFKKSLSLGEHQGSAHIFICEIFTN